MSDGKFEKVSQLMGCFCFSFFSSLHFHFHCVFKWGANWCEDSARSVRIAL